MCRLDRGWHRCLGWGTLEGDPTLFRENHSAALSSREFMSSFLGAAVPIDPVASLLGTALCGSGCLWVLFAFEMTGSHFLLHTLSEVVCLGMLHNGLSPSLSYLSLSVDLPPQQDG